MSEGRLRKALVELLRGGGAHVTAQQAFEGLEPGHRTARPAPGQHTVWELLEHMRIAQEDILRYTVEPGWRSPKWPEGYWPTVPEPTAAQWKSSLKGFFQDLEAVCALVQDPARDLLAEIPHGEGRTALREVLLVADHNAYHLGQVVETRKLLGGWQ